MFGAQETTPNAIVAASAVPALDLFYPMNEFYDRSSKPIPSLLPLPGNEVPEPHRSLLVHDRDMTPTLTEAYQRTMQLRILDRFLTDDIFSRKIVLEVQGEATVTVFAAIKIYLDRFPAEARRLILEGKTPFGTVLHRQGIVHSSKPQTFFQVQADDEMRAALHLVDSPVLYGRRSALLNGSHLPLAQVLEILPPSR